MVKQTELYVKYNKLRRYITSVKNSVSYRDILQIACTTEFDRHPDLFSYCQKLLGKNSLIKALSFGCSTGEECFSLKMYFPNASIIGCDIIKKSLRIANKKNKSKDIKFVIYKKLNNSSKFNLILANSVLCKQPEDRFCTNLSKIFPFSQFNTFIVKLDSYLLLNGIIAIRHSNYKLEDTDVGYKYRCVFSAKTDFPLFDKQGEKIIGSYEKCEIFQKVILY